ncbi:hypothetical protein [Nocardioides alkalitolerans]|uniref:hypothetical protein n=1 Tax=Nocardioides alkalitolerans TaxID=281714 RepID=UPI00041285BE|nr:hypothetical protein [Nocardioides alkalitolerans]
MDWTVTTYLGYLAITLPITVWVARTLFTNGAAFLADVFDGRTDLAAAVNHLLVVGFYLLNVGFVLLFLRVGDPVPDAGAMLEALSVKVGVVLLVVGAVHFLNIVLFNSIRKRHGVEQAQRATAGASALRGPGPGQVGGYPPYPAPGR